MLEHLKKNFDEYSLRARVFPCLLALLPLFLLGYLFLSTFVNLGFLKSIFSSSLFTVVALFLAADTVRNLGKRLEQKVFNSELEFPTTYLLLHSSEAFTPEKRRQIYTKMGNDFGCTLSTPMEEQENLGLAKQRLKEAIGLVRQKVENGRLLLDYNIRYGFWRNLIGVAPVSMFLCLTGSITTFVSGSFGMYIFFSAIFVFYGSIYIFSGPLLRFFGEQYAEQLFLEYLK